VQPLTAQFAASSNAKASASAAVIRIKRTMGLLNTRLEEEPVRSGFFFLALPGFLVDRIACGVGVERRLSLPSSALHLLAGLPAA